MSRFTKTLAVFAAAFTAATAVTQDALSVCSALNTAYPHQVAYNGLSLNFTLNYDYSQATTRYWSAANADADNLPACVFFPTEASEVQHAVRVLLNYTSVPWAVKGGGHNPNVGFSSTSGGLLIAMETMAGTTLDENKLAHIGPGARWADVADALVPSGRAVASGRLGDVGVAGLLLGGGLSFLSTQYGMAADTVVNYQCVTAAGELINANATSNTDIYYALKGAGNQFVIVTEFVLQTFEVGRVWGGTKIYSLDKKDAILNATHKLTSDYYDPKAAVIVTFSTTLHNFVDIFVVFYYYDDAAGPGEILSDFQAIEADVDQTSANRTFYDVVNSNSEFSLSGMRYLIRAGTVPNLPAAQGMDLYNYAFDSWYNISKQGEQAAGLDNFVFSMAFQPFPHQIANASLSSPYGRNVLGLNPDAGDLMFLEYDLSWDFASSDSLADQYETNVSLPVQSYSRSKYAGVPPTHYVSGNTDVTSYNPLFFNDAMYNQDPLRSYGNATYAKLKQIQKKCDPDGFFSTRTGGFKFS